MSKLIKWKVKQVTRADFTWEEIKEAYDESLGNMAKTAKLLSQLGRGKVSRQLVRYWINTEIDEPEDNHYNARNVKAKQQIQDTNRELRKQLRDLSRYTNSQETIIDAVIKGLEDIHYIYPPQPVRNNPKTEGTPITAEILVSDLQIGKLTSNYSTEVAKKRLYEVAKAIQTAIKQKEKAGYCVEQINVILLGDLIESDEKHDDSSIGCDSTTSEQVSDCISALHTLLLSEIYSLGLHVKVVALPGNHDWNGKGLRSVKPGRTQLSYPIFKALELLSTELSLDVEWEIPEGVFFVDDIYGQKILYEHGVGVAPTEAGMRKRKLERSDQTGQYISLFRMGHLHSVATFNNAQYVINGAFFGGGKTGAEYSEIQGYHSEPAQWIGFHTPRGDSRTTLFDQFVIQLSHIE